MGDCHVNVQGCGPCLGTCVSGDVGGVCVGIGVNINVGARFCISVAQLQKVFLAPGTDFLRQNFPFIEEEFS